MFNYRLETQLFEGALGIFRRGHIWVGAHLDVVEIIGGRGGYEGWEFFLLDSIGHFEGVALQLYGGYLQDDGILVQRGRLEAGGLLRRSRDGLGGCRGRRVL